MYFYSQGSNEWVCSCEVSSALLPFGGVLIAKDLSIAVLLMKFCEVFIWKVNIDDVPNQGLALEHWVWVWTDCNTRQQCLTPHWVRLLTDCDTRWQVSDTTLRYWLYSHTKHQVLTVCDTRRQLSDITLKCWLAVLQTCQGCQILSADFDAVTDTGVLTLKECLTSDSVLTLKQWLTPDLEHWFIVVSALTQWVLTWWDC